MNKSTFSLEFCVHFPIAGAEKPNNEQHLCTFYIYKNGFKIWLDTIY